MRNQWVFWAHQIKMCRIAVVHWIFTRYFVQWDYVNFTALHSCKTYVSHYILSLYRIKGLSSNFLNQCYSYDKIILIQAVKNPSVCDFSWRSNAILTYWNRIIIDTICSQGLSILSHWAIWTLHEVYWIPFWKGTRIISDKHCNIYCVPSSPIVRIASIEEQSQPMQCYPCC